MKERGQGMVISQVEIQLRQKAEAEFFISKFIVFGKQVWALYKKGQISKGRIGS